MAIATGGIAQILAGMWEVLFTLFGSFWLSYAVILIPGSGIVASYPTLHELHTALGFFFTAWFAIAVLITFASLKKPRLYIVLFAFVSSAFAFLGAGEFTAIHALTTVGGALMIVVALIAYYLAIKILIAADQPPALPI
ncbi:GPR1/FUN34/yaaH family-domain-containing protein [Mycena pura]|uniref:GPR1/FUN34/yaaH family-domain-containing protein n=1 Tax=Mycena pura TaxID=153505 RepID=A0AAD6VLX4_9AGAR|nr:GPR1/FUN34/yaaH family-domain-containing protein [Mycena pura]